MNQRKLNSLPAPPATGFVHFVLPLMVCLGMSGLVSTVQADQTQTNKATVNLGELSLESLMQLEVPVVSSASKFAQKSTDAPAFVTVVSADEMHRYGYRTLADVLQSV